MNRLKTILKIVGVIAVNIILNFATLHVIYKAHNMRQVRVPIKVEDERGVAVPYATVSGYFETPLSKDYAREFKGMTDKNGEYTIKGVGFSAIELSCWL